MGFVEKKVPEVVIPEVVEQVSEVVLNKVKMKRKAFSKLNFETIDSNDYWSFKSLNKQRKYIKANPDDIENSPTFMLHQGQTKDSLNNLFGAPTLYNYNEGLYDIWLMECNGRLIVIRQSDEYTKYDINIDSENLDNDLTEIGKEIEVIMEHLLTLYK